MLTRRLGKSSLEVSAIGLGCWAAGGEMWATRDGVTREPMGWAGVDEAEINRALHRALDLGITLFDTANNYGCGESERRLGRALAEAGARQRVVVATKFASMFDEATRTHHFDWEFPFTPEAIETACDDSLRRLQTDYIDLYQLHHGQYPAEQAPAVMDALESLVAKGKIRWYGWSTDLPDRAAVFAPGDHCAAIQHRLNLLNDAPEILALCDAHNLASLNKGPLASGFLTGKYTTDTTFPSTDGRYDIDLKTPRMVNRLGRLEEIRAVLTRDGRTLAQAALCWNLARSPRTIPIPGFKTVAQVEDNAGALRFGPFTPAQMAEIETALDRATLIA
jgi:aryl-alcohol dehydrogenase-like predicted oxidoreductase